MIDNLIRRFFGRTIEERMFYHHASTEELKQTLLPLAKIADLFDLNQLGPPAQKRGCCVENPFEPRDIVLLRDRNTNPILTLADCLAARTALTGEK